MMRRLLLISVVLGCALGAAAATWIPAAPGYEWQFPRDLAVHPEYKTEWWYFTGHLEWEDEPEAEALGYQLTFFRSGMAPAESLEKASAWQPEDIIMAHAAISDPSSGEHIFSEVIWRTTPFLGGFGQAGDSVLAWCQAPAGTDDQWELEWIDGAFHLRVRDDAQKLRYELKCVPTRPRIFHGEDGFSPKTADGKNGSLYFSQTRLETSGSVYRNDKKRTVKGKSWLDREIFSSTLAGNQTGWDWAAIGLDDGRDLMLYRLRDADGVTDFAVGDIVGPDGVNRTLPAEEWQWEALDYWESEETESRYPVRWKLVIPGQELELLVEAVMPDQENVSGLTGIHYWEGAVLVHPWNDQDVVLGRGFVELTGYGAGSRPPI